MAQLFRVAGHGHADGRIGEALAEVVGVARGAIAPKILPRQQHRLVDLGSVDKQEHLAPERGLFDQRTRCQQSRRVEELDRPCGVLIAEQGRLHQCEMRAQSGRERLWIDTAKQLPSDLVLAFAVGQRAFQQAIDFQREVRPFEDGADDAGAPAAEQEQDRGTRVARLLPHRRVDG